MEDSKLKIQILVVEDDILLAQDISSRLKELNYEVVGIAPSVDKAIHILRDNPRIDIALLDIMLNGEQDGIDLAKIIKSEYKIPFIFLTSLADHVTIERIKQIGAYSYILKPFNDRQVSIAIELALVNFSNNKIEKELSEKREFSKEENQLFEINDCLFLKKGQHFERVPIKDILFLEAEGNYTTIHTTNERFVYSVVLKNIEAKFPIGLFLRVHRSFVVNISAINGFEGNLLFIGPHKIPVSKSYRDEVFRVFTKI